MSLSLFFEEQQQADVSSSEVMTFLRCWMIGWVPTLMGDLRAYQVEVEDAVCTAVQSQASP